MAVKWSVTPTEGAENLGGGKFKFTPPSSGSKVYTITYDDGKSDPATTTYTVSAGECVTCNCSKITSFTPSVTSIDASGGPMELARLKLSSDFCKDNTKIKFVNKEHVDNFIVEDAESSDLEKVIKGTVEPNDTAQARDVKFVVEFYGSPCPDEATFSVPQVQGCKCEDFTFTCTATGNSMYIGVEAQTVKVGTIVINSSCAVRAVGLTPGITMSISNGEVFANVEANTTRLSKKLMYGFEMEGVGRCGDDFTLIQNLARGTDNGSDMFGPGIPPFSHPVLLNGNANDNCDTIVSEGGAYLKGYWLIRNGEKSEYVDKGKVWFNNNFASFVIDGWLTIDADKNGSCHYCNVSGVRVSAIANNTNEIRSAILLLGTDGDHVLTKAEGCTHDPGLAGQPVLAEWEFEIKQAPNGKKWCCPEEKCNDCHSYTRVPVDMNYNCPCSKDNPN